MGPDCAAPGLLADARFRGQFRLGTCSATIILARLSPDERHTLTAAFGLDGRAAPPQTWAGKRRLNAALAAAAREAGVR